MKNFVLLFVFSALFAFTRAQCTNDSATFDFGPFGTDGWRATSIEVSGYVSDASNFYGDNNVSDAFDGAFSWRVNGVDFSPSTNRTCQDNSTFSSSQTAIVTDLDAQVFFYIDPASNFISSTLAVTNVGTTSLTVDIEVYGDVGSDSDTQLDADFNNNGIVDLGDKYITTSDNATGDPPLGFLVFSTVPPSNLTSILGSGNDDYGWLWTVTIPAGETRAIQSIITLSISIPSAQTSVSSLLNAVTAGTSSVNGGIPMNIQNVIVNNAKCGNGVLNSGEQCDDANFVAGDGCDLSCMVESGFTCSGEPSVCTASSDSSGATLAIGCASSLAVLFAF